MDKQLLPTSPEGNLYALLRRPGDSEPGLRQESPSTPPKGLKIQGCVWKGSSNLLSRGRSLGRAINEWISGLAQFENPIRREVVRLVTGAAALTEINSIRQLNIGMALSTGASNHS